MDNVCGIDRGETERPGNRETGGEIEVQRETDRNVGIKM